MITTPEITTIICTYRRPEMLKRAITSVLNQTYNNFKICIYDNASGDETAEVVAHFAQGDSRIEYYCHPENIGLLGNYSHALKYISTPFFSFLADDDLILPNFYEVALSGFKKEPKAFSSSTSFLCLSLLGNKVGSVNFQNEILYPPNGAFKFAESGLLPHLHGTLIRSDFLSTPYIFKHVWDDMDLLYRIAAAYPIVLNSEECLIFTRHDVNKGGGSATIDQAWLPLETVLNSLKTILSKDLHDKLERIFDMKVRSEVYFLGIELIYKGDFAGATIGANKLKYQYKLHRQSFILKLLIKIFTIFPFVLSFLRAVRDLRPYIRGQSQKEIFPVLSYEYLMDIYTNKKY